MRHIEPIHSLKLLNKMKKKTVRYTQVASTFWYNDGPLHIIFRHSCPIEKDIFSSYNTFERTCFTLVNGKCVSVEP